MNRRNAFGNTWWGNAWVEAMRRIDYNTNRLPRGYTYANAGRVKNISINNGMVEALVQGTRPKPYKVILRLNICCQKNIAPS